MKKAFKILAVILSIAFVMGAFAACGNSSGDGKSKDAKLSKKELEKLKGEWRMELPKESGDMDYETRVVILTINEDDTYTVKELVVIDKEKFRESVYNEVSSYDEEQLAEELDHWGVSTLEEAVEKFYKEDTEKNEEIANKNVKTYDSFAKRFAGKYELDGNTLIIDDDGDKSVFKRA